MYFLLILFFISLIGIVVMIGRKLALIKNGQILESYDVHPFIPDFHKVRSLSIESLKKYGHLSIVSTLRFYIRSTNILKSKYNEVKIKINDLRNRNTTLNTVLSDKKQISKFLKIISEYKHKIREIKHKIHEEEKSL